MVMMSDFTTEQLKAIIAFGIETIQEVLEERLEEENKKNFPIKVGDYFFDELEQSVCRITNVSIDKIYYEFVRVHSRSIISSYNSYVDRDSHNFDSMIKIDKNIFDSIQNIAKNYEIKSNELKLSSVKSANNIMSSIKNK